jgi:hypothetical protein
LTNTKLSLKKITNQFVETRDRRIAKSIVVAYSCEISKVKGEKETYLVQSESNIDKFYTVKFMNSCPIICDRNDWKYRSNGNPNHFLCKHQRAVILAENYGLVKPTTKIGDEYSY